MLSGPRREAGSLGNKYDPIRRVLNRLARPLDDHRLYPIIVHARASISYVTLEETSYCSESHLGSHSKNLDKLFLECIAFPRHV